MAFFPTKPVAFDDVKIAVIGNSQTIAIGDAIINGATSAAGFVITGASTSVGICGVVQSIIGLNGQVLEKSSITTASNNQTVGLIAVQYIPTYIPMEYRADLTAAAGTTNYSKLPGMFAMSSSAGKLDETTWTVFTTVKQFYSYGVNPLSTTQVFGHWTPAVGQV